MSLPCLPKMIASSTSCSLRRSGKRIATPSEQPTSEEFAFRNRPAVPMAGDGLTFCAEARAPRRQGRDHRVALHRIRGGRADLALRLGDIVHHLPAHHSQAVVVVT